MILGLIILLIFIVLGLFVGQNLVIPYSSYQYVAVAILACLDSVFGAAAASTGKNFKMHIFLSGFFFNALFSIFLVYLGELLNVELYLAPIIVFGGRILNNFSILRRDFFDKAHANTQKIRNNRKEKSVNAIKTDIEAQNEVDNMED